MGSPVDGDRLGSCSAGLGSPSLWARRDGVPSLRGEPQASPTRANQKLAHQASQPKVPEFLYGSLVFFAS